MVGDERGDEIVAVVVVIVPAQLERLIGGVAGSFEHLRIELFAEEFVAPALIDEDSAGELLLADELARVPRPPALFVGAEVIRERFLAPRAAHRRANRGE